MTPPCWFCGATAAAVPMLAPSGAYRCEDRGECLARAVFGGGQTMVADGPAAHPTDQGACDPEEPACCAGCAGAYAMPDGDETEE